jgi:hypothetical protein
MAKKKFIAGAIKHPGALTAKAKRAGESVAAYAAHPPKNISTTTKREINFYQTLNRLRPKGKKK